MNLSRHIVTGNGHKSRASLEYLTKLKMMAIDVSIPKIKMPRLDKESQLRLDRESYVNLETGEPIGPDEPIPTGRPYEAPAPRP